MGIPCYSVCAGDWLRMEYFLFKRQSNKKETDVYVDTEVDLGLSSEKKKTQNVDEEIF